MATIDDFGGTTDPLNQPALGGPSGWAAAVRDYIKDLPTAIAGKVSKSGDTMTGALTLPGNPTVALHAATKQYVDNRSLKVFAQMLAWEYRGTAGHYGLNLAAVLPAGAVIHGVSVMGWAVADGLSAGVTGGDAANFTIYVQTAAGAPVSGANQQLSTIVVYS